MEASSILLIIASLYVGWNIGANDAANCMGTAVGANLVHYKKAIMLVAIIALIGAALQGSSTIKTVGEGIVNPTQISESEAAAALFAAGFLVTILTIFGLPVSTTQSVIGAIAGLGAWIGIEVMWAKVTKIYLLGFANALISLILAYLIYRYLNRALTSGRFLAIEKRLGTIVVLSGIFFAYTLGANNVGNAMGLIVEKNIIPLIFGGLIGGIALAFGVVSLGGKVMRTIGKEITILDPSMALSAQLASATSVYSLTLMGIPTSTSFAIVGAIVGVGLVKGAAALGRSTLKKIVLGWALTPFLAAIISIILFNVIKLF
ncbi:inorganic phosphate transporter [Candidatus Woesearchaeota archaeon]|nr:inorganic phosphate transporter [Candidatus Woesearchaeota archaeon]